MEIPIHSKIKAKILDKASAPVAPTVPAQQPVAPTAPVAPAQQQGTTQNQQQPVAPVQQQNN